MELLVLKYLNANDGDETYVRVLAGKQFYIYPTTVIEPDDRSVGAKDQREEENGANPGASAGTHSDCTKSLTTNYRVRAEPTSAATTSGTEQ